MAEEARGRCPSCGARYEQGEALCSQCGARIGGAPGERDPGASSAALPPGAAMAFTRARQNPDCRGALETPHSRLPSISIHIFLLCMGLVLIGMAFMTGSKPKTRNVRVREVTIRIPRVILVSAGGLLVLGGGTGILLGVTRPVGRRLVFIKAVGLPRRRRVALLVTESGKEEIAPLTTGAWQLMQPGRVGVGCFVGRLLVEFRGL